MKKKLVVKDRTKCQACLTCAVECSMAFYKKEGLGCIDITTKKDGSINVQACNQCGVCAKKCPEQAISQNAKGVYVIDKKKCTGCLTCVEACWRKLPLLVSEHVGNHPEVVKQGENGYVFSYREPENAVKIINSVIEADSLWFENASRKSYEIALELYGPKEQCNRIWAEMHEKTKIN